MIIYLNYRARLAFIYALRVIYIEYFAVNRGAIPEHDPRAGFFEGELQK
jgi:hypothetical protein